ncbi:hypothetical protein ERE_33680 [Agathobacter rectalis M104/1]|nr:hypothetical protein [Agathobacter rectalis]CBK95114.1 hypothetical protein ERE_33680 [Agathobacter rectalis M104/1]
MDINEKMIVEETTRKDIIGYIDEHLDYGCFIADFETDLIEEKNQ